MNNKMITRIILSIGRVTCIILVSTRLIGLNNQPSPFADYPSGLINDNPSERLVDEQITQTGLEIQQAAPDFTLQTVTGETITLSNYRGKKVILNFWASWCPPCRKEMPHMESYYTNKQKENVEIIAVNMTTRERGSLKTVEQFVEEYELSFPIPLDSEGIVMKTYQVNVFPTTYVIDEDGIITEKIHFTLDEQQLAKLVQ